jgi:3-keto-5-aminohexanoate cleavage enzyme
MSKVIITASLTGGVHDKSANPNLPEQPDEIIEQALECAAAGAAIVHCHARLPNGRPTCDPEIFQTIHDGIRSQSDVIVQLTTGGGLGLSVEERYGVISLGPEMASLNMGLLNFIFGGKEHFFSNMRSDILEFAQEMKRRDVKPELEVYNMAMLEEAQVLLAQGLLEPPWVINLVLDTPTQGGIRGTPVNLVEMVRRIHEAFEVGEQGVMINVTSCGATQLPISTIALAMGLNVRVGMEDNVFFRRGELVKRNAQLVERAVRIAEQLDREPATPDEARKILRLKAPVAATAN